MLEEEQRSIPVAEPLPDFDRSKLAPKSTTREQKFVDALLTRTIYHAKKGKRAHAYERWTMFFAAVIQLVVTVLLAVDVISAGIAAIGTVLPAGLLTLAHRMRWKALRKWRYVYHNKLSDLRRRIIFDMVPMTTAVDELNKIEIAMHDSHPELGNIDKEQQEPTLT